MVKEITATIEKKINDRAAMKSIRPALAKLLLWFRENTSRAKKLFPMLYDQKHLLYDDEQILDNIERAEELSDAPQRIQRQERRTSFAPSSRSTPQARSSCP